MYCSGLEFSQDTCPGAGLQDRIVTLFLVLIYLFLIISDIEYLSLCRLSSLEKCLYRSSPISFDWDFFLILSSMSCLYTLKINLLSIASFANIFSHSVGCLFSLFIVVSFAIQKLLSLIRSHLFYFCFYVHYSRRPVQKDISAIYVKQCSAYVFL